MRAALVLLGVAAGLTLAPTAYAGGLVKLATDSTKLTDKRVAKVGDMDMISAAYPVDKAVQTGFFGLNGSQYRISLPDAAEVVHVVQGENSWIDRTGQAYRVKAGDVLFFAARRPSTARDAVAYSDHYVLFSATGAASDKMPNMMKLSPAELDDGKFTPAPGGREHVYLASDEGSRVVAWRADDQGSVKNSTDVRYLAVTAGSAVFSEAGSEIEIAAGDTLLIPPGSSFEWRARGLAGVYVSARPNPTAEAPR